MRPRSKRRGRLLDMYHSKLKFLSFAELKLDPHLSHVLFDQYLQALRILNEQRIEEDQAYAEIAKKSRKEPICPAAYA